MTGPTAHDLRQEAWRRRLAYAHIAELASARRRETARRHTIMAGAASVALVILALVFRA